jgi:hypothetical protein
MTKRLYPIGAALVVLCLVAAPRARAAIIPITNPTPAYQAQTTLIPITAPDFTVVSSVTGGGLTVSFSQMMQARTVTPGDPSNWDTWSVPPNSENATPRILFTGPAGMNQTQTSVTLSFSHPVSTFGVEMQPNNFDIYSLTADFYNGVTLLGSITRLVDGLGEGDPNNPNPGGGARLFAATIFPGGLPFTSVVLHANEGQVGPFGTPGPNGFAIAEIRFSESPLPIPEPGSLAVLGVLLAGVIGRRLTKWKRAPD